MFEITKEPYLQSFQYKILNRILNNKQNLYRLKISQTDQCNVGKEVDGVEHRLYLGYAFKPTLCEVLFGIPNVNSTDIKLFNSPREMVYK